MTQVWHARFPYKTSFLNTCSFAVSTETKCGRPVKAPGKFSTCVTGKRKPHQTRRQNSEVFNMTDSTMMTMSSDADVTTSSLIVNTSETTTTEIGFESAYTELLNTSLEQDASTLVDDSMTT